MEHRKKGRKLGRTASHRKALLSNLSIALIKYKRIITTLAKAKELRTVIEPLVTKAIKANVSSSKNPENSVHLRREARKIVKDKDALNILFGEVAEKAADRKGGYTRVLKLGVRPGDSSETAIIEFVDYDVVEEAKAKEKSKEKIKASKKDSKEDTGAETNKEVKEIKVKKEKKEKNDNVKKTKTEKKAKTTTAKSHKKV